MYSTLLTTVFSLSSLLSALPLASQVKRDLWTPSITCPTRTTVWAAGSTYNVTWSTANEPSEITNPIGQIILRHGNDTTNQVTLAQGFNLTDGFANVTVPASTQPDTDYIVILFGDSGDWSPEFTIVAPSS